jgi:hypothetical protein
VIFLRGGDARVHKIFLTVLAFAGPLVSAASAQANHTWLYATNAHGGIAWDQTDLVWSEVDKSFRGSFITYTKSPVLAGDKAVHFVLEDFHLKCTGPEYFYENVVLYGADKKMVSTMFATKQVPIAVGSPYYILSEVLCKGTHFPDGRLLRNVNSTVEVMTSLAGQ